MHCTALAPLIPRCAGLRILRQPIWECLVSFLLSSNNNVKRISGIVERLCKRYGRDMGGRFAFPEAETLAKAGEAGIKACGAGYRAAYVAEAARAVAGGFEPDALRHMGYEAAKKELLRLKGAGEKVADCVLLYSCGYGEAFPVDVWVLRAMHNYFPEAGKSAKEIRLFAAERFGVLSGLAQQYLFHYERSMKDKENSYPP
jgi:N-glycosylase/DNA lyase